MSEDSSTPKPGDQLPTKRQGVKAYALSPNLSLQASLKPSEDSQDDEHALKGLQVRVVTRATKLTQARARAFLVELAQSGNVTGACAVAGVSRKQVYRIKARDKAFGELWDEAIQMAVDTLEAECRRRAVEGVERIKYDRQGKLLQTERVYSDKLMELLLRAKRPAEYRDKENTLNVALGISFQMVGLDSDAQSPQNATNAPQQAAAPPKTLDIEEEETD